MPTFLVHADFQLLEGVVQYLEATGEALLDAAGDLGLLVLTRLLLGTPNKTVESLTTHLPATDIEKSAPPPSNHLSYFVQTSGLRMLSFHSNFIQALLQPLTRRQGRQPPPSLPPSPSLLPLTSTAFLASSLSSSFSSFSPSSHTLCTEESRRE